MNIQLEKTTFKSNQSIAISGSKSETNRLLLLQALYPTISLENASNSDDSVTMQAALLSNEDTINVHHAGTAMRFLTAYFSIQSQREVVITGSSRMKERPIKILVEALQELGADITYIENNGYPPLLIKGRQLTKHQVSLAANVSSQYISALLLIGASLENGIELTLEGEITSIPYINMTLELLKTIGIKTSFVANKIRVETNTHPFPKTITIESDWSSASYFYTMIALSDVGTNITLSSYKPSSLQGDSMLVEVFNEFGVTTHFNKDNTMVLSKETIPVKQHFEFNLNKVPDIAQTIAVCCLGIGVSCHLTGLQTLKIKETDRLQALYNELNKLGATIQITEDSLTIGITDTIKENCSIATYQDHRMAMAFAPLAIKVPLVIEEAEVVSKSFPAFWNDLEKLGFKIQTTL